MGLSRICSLLLISVTCLLRCDSVPTVVDPPLVDCTTFPAVAGPPSSYVLSAQARTVLFQKVLECRTPEVPGSSNFPTGTVPKGEGRIVQPEKAGAEPGSFVLYELSP